MVILTRPVIRSLAILEISQRAISSRICSYAQFSYMLTICVFGQGDDVWLNGFLTAQNLSVGTVSQTS